MGRIVKIVKIVVGLFLAVHGLIHVTYFVPSDDPRYPMAPARSWLVSRAGVPLGVVRILVRALAILATVGFCLFALSYLGLLVPSAWFVPLGVVSAAVSLAVITATWNTQFIVGAAIDLGILIWVLF
jgi:hypothetical protein